MIYKNHHTSTMKINAVWVLKPTLFQSQIIKKPVRGLVDVQGPSYNHHIPTVNQVNSAISQSRATACNFTRQDVLASSCLIGRAISVPIMG